MTMARWSPIARQPLMMPRHEPRTVLVETFEIADRYRHQTIHQDRVQCQSHFENRRAAKRPGTPQVERHSGMTLLEVVIALAMLFAALAVISEILSTGAESSIKAQLRADATLLGESKLAEIVSGVVPLTPVQGETFEGHPRWTWTLTVEDLPDLSLKSLKLTVNHLNTADKSDHQVLFARYMRDPLIFQQSSSSSSTLDTIQSVLP